MKTAGERETGCVCYLNAFREDEERCENEEESVDEAGQHFCSDITKTQMKRG